MKVRIVEDTEDIAFLLESILGDRVDVQVTTRNFEDLLSREPWEGIDAALVDFMLPGEIDGGMILRYLKGEFPDIRRVLFTAVTPVPERIADYADTIVAKPASSSDEILWALGVKRGTE